MNLLLARDMVLTERREPRAGSHTEWYKLEEEGFSREESVEQEVRVVAGVVFSSF